MTGTIQPYAWGSTTVLPQFLGREPDGQPQAELWLGAHPSAPSRLGESSLLDLIAADPAGVLGATSVANFGTRLPYLLKVLAADQPLSLQAHPTRAQAEAGFAREQAEGIPSERRVFADDWPKPEMMIALTPTDALCGFRDPAQTYELFAGLGVHAATALVEPLRTGGADALRQVLGQVLTLQDRGLVGQVLAAAQDHDSHFTDTAGYLDKFFPGDPGILAALLLNRLQLAPGDALYLPAGNLHAYLGGSGVEIMANSDNTLRGGLTGKLVAVDTLLDVLDFVPGRPPLVEAVGDGPGVWRYPTPAPEFRLWRLEPAGAAVAVPGHGAGRIMLCIAGDLAAATADRELALTRGRAIFCHPGDEVDISGSGQAVLAAPGVS